MAFDIKEKIEELTDKIKNDPKMLASFKEEPVKTIEKLIGIDLPDDKIEAIVDGIKAKISLDKLGDALGGLGNLFKK